MKKATFQKYDSFQADLDATWQWGVEWGGGRIKDTGPPRKWETDPPENLQICTEIHQCWKRSRILEVRKCQRKHYEEDSEGRVHLGTVWDSSVCWDAFQGSPVGEKPARCFSLILPEEAESDHRHSTLHLWPNM